MATFCTEHPNRESWLAARKNGVGASEVSVVLGINSYKSAYTLWAEKTGRIEPEEPGLAAAVGVALEPMIAGLYETQTGYTLEHEPFTMYHHPTAPLFATLDRTAHTPDGPRVVEIKSIGERAWQALKEGEASLAHLVQVQAQLACTGYETGDLACLVGNRLFEVFPVARHEKLIAQIVRRVTDFWQCVETNTPPDVDGSKSTTATLYALHPEQEPGKAIEASLEMAEAVERLTYLTDRLAEMDCEKAELQNRIKAMMGDAETAHGEGFRVTWKTQTRKEHTVKASTARVLRVSTTKGE
jgi:putative phage-type endonuclease